MAIPSITEDFDTLYSTTWQLMRDTAADNIFDATPLWQFLQSEGRIRRETGGRWIGVQLEYNTHDDSVTWFGRSHSFTPDDADVDLITTARFDWKYLAGGLYRSYVDDSQNRGRQQMISIVDKKLSNLEKTLASELESRLFGSAGADQMNGLKDLVQEDPTSDETVGEINQSDESWWRNQYTDMEDDNPSVHLLPEMRTMFNDVSVGADTPNVIVTSQQNYELYEDEVLEYKQIVNQREGDASYDSILFKGRDLIWSPSCDDDKMYFLNTDYIELVGDSEVWFEMTDWKDIDAGELDRAAQIVTMLNLVTSNRRMQGVIFNVGEES